MHVHVVADVYKKANVYEYKSWNIYSHGERLDCSISQACWQVK